MMISTELLAQHFEYSLWASLKVLELVERLPVEGIEKDRGNSFGGILGTLTHIFQADRIWWKRFTAQPYRGLAEEGETLDLAALKAQWPAVMGSFVEWIRSQDAEQLEQRLEWRNLKGEEKNEVKYKLLLHVVNHGTYHRGQVITMIKQAGGDVVSTDLLFYPGM
jgi:uncharacterized damage-inducible protein DinB